MNDYQKIIRDSRKSIHYEKEIMRKAKHMNDLKHKYIVLLGVDNLVSSKNWGRERNVFIALGFWREQDGQPFCPYGPQIVRYNDVKEDSGLRGYRDSVTCYLPKSYAVKYTHKLNTQHGYNNHAQLMTIQQFLTKFSSMFDENTDI